jgi:hypothetical protein
MATSEARIVYITNTGTALSLECEFLRSIDGDESTRQPLIFYQQRQALEPHLRDIFSVRRQRNTAKSKVVGQTSESNAPVKPTPPIESVPHIDHITVWIHENKREYANLLDKRR